MQKRIQIYGISEATFEKIRTQAKDLGIDSISEYAKAVLVQAVNGNKPPLANLPLQANVKISADQVELSQAESQWIKPSLKLNPVETAFLNEAAAQADMSVSAFIRMALRSQMTKMAILNNDEVTALYQSNFQLLRIGRNLNQIARAHNAQESVEVTSQKIEDVESLINDHTDKVRDLITSNQERLQ